MEEAGKDKVSFIDSIDNYDIAELYDKVVHILCLDGSMSFDFRNTHYNIAEGDYVIITNVSFVSGLTRSEDFKAVSMCFPESFVTPMALRSNYGIIGHLSLLQNPVMKLSGKDFIKCRTDLLRIRERLSDNNHLFKEEMISYLLAAHILDLYDIHARANIPDEPSERTFILLGRFIAMLYKKEYMRHRDLPYYASELCITPHYLSEICKKVSGRPATYWIDRFTLQEVTRLLCQKELTLKDVAARMNFSSVSYFSRYVQKRTGLYPTEYRKSLFLKRQQQ